MAKKPLTAELETLKRERKRLEREHMGKWVLIHGDEVVSTFDTFENAADEGLRLFGRGPFLIRQVGRDVVDIPIAVALGLTRADHPSPA